MRHKTRVFLGVVLIAIAIVALSATTAIASTPDTYTVSIGITRTSGVYGQDFVITPTLIGTETVVNDKYTIQALQPDGVTWANFGEGLQVDDTGTLVPQDVITDETFLPWYVGGIWQPTQFRVIYQTPRSKDASGNMLSYNSAVEGFPVVPFHVNRLRTVKITASIPKTVKRNHTFTIAGFTVPDCGIGNMAFSISRSGFHTQSFTVETDESGYASIPAKLKRKGSYTIRMRWLGNAFGPGSKTLTKHVTVK